MLICPSAGTSPIGVSTASPSPSQRRTDPLQDAAVLAEPGPDEVAVVILAKPVDEEYPRQLLGIVRRRHPQPVTEVVGHVVAAERQHRDRVEAELADLARGCGGGLYRHRGAEEDAVLPVERLGDQGHHARPAPAEKEGVDRHSVGVLPLGGDRGALGRGRREPRVRVRGGLSESGVQSLPRQSIAWSGRSSVIPSHQTSPSSVRAQLVKIEFARSVAIAFGFVFGLVFGRDAEEARLGVDRVQATVLAELHPGDVVADRLRLPAVQGGDQHREVGLPGSRREGPGHVLHLAPGEVSLRISMCSASQPSSRAIAEAIRSAKHFLPSSALPPYPEP